MHDGWKGDREERLSRFITDILELMALADPPRPVAEWVGVNMDIRVFDGADPFFDETFPDVDEPFIPSALSPNSDLARLPVVVLSPTKDGDGVGFLRVKREHPRRWRGRVRLPVPSLCSALSMRVDTKTGECTYSLDLYARSGNRFVRADFHERERMTGSGDRFIKVTQGILGGVDPKGVAAAVGWSAVRHAFWRVYLRLDDGPIGVTISTDATGVKELFRLRDKPIGRKRRLPLLHWVKGHYRRSRKDPEVEVWVRKHVRGRMEFSWFGLQGVITPSQDDLERLIAIFKGQPSPKVVAVADKYASVPNQPIGG